MIVGGDGDIGHERDAFTGAMTQKKGNLEIADGGTVFLDEVGELAPALQSRLLRALDLREFERVGGARPMRVDIRVISGTNRRLPDDVAAGRYRTAYDWPGNIRELENTIERAIVLGISDYIERDDLPDALLQRPASGDVEGSRFHDAVRQAKVGVIVAAVREGHHSYTEAARLLGLRPNYLHRLIRTLDMKSILEPDR